MEFQELEAKNRVTSFINCNSDPILERILTPRLALTFAEYLAYEKQMHVLVVITGTIIILLIPICLTLISRYG